MELNSERTARPWWALSWESAEDRARAVAGAVAFWARFHLVRSVKYVWRLLRRSPHGFVRVVWPVLRWASDPEGRESASISRRQAHNGRGVGTMRGLQHDHRWAVRMRTGAVVVGVLVVVSPLAAIGLYPTNWFEIGLATFLVALVLGWFGRGPRGITDSPKSNQRAPAVTPALIVKALEDAGIPNLRRAIDKARRRMGGPDRDFTNDEAYEVVPFISDPMTTPEGWMAEFDLPGGVTLAALAAKRNNVASSLRRRPTCVHLLESLDESDHAGRVRLIVTRAPLSKLRPKIMYPGTDVDREFDIFTDPVPIGEDPAGDEVGLHLDYAAGLGGAQPRTGKSFGTRVVVAGAIEDDLVEFHGYDLRGELRCFAPVAAALRSGYSPADLRALRDDLRWLVSEAQRRERLIADHPEMATEEKVTRAMAEHPEMRCVPILVVIDEFHIPFRSEYGDEIQRDYEYLCRVGQAVMIMMIGTTQKPSADAMPTAIRAQKTWRFGLAVENQAANDMILGQGMHSAGYRLTPGNLDPREDKGVGILAGQGPPKHFKFYYLDSAAALAKAERLRERRLARGGHLVGQAVGDDRSGATQVDEDTDTILHIVLDHWPVNEDEARSSEILAALQAADSAEFGSWTTARVTQAIKAAAPEGYQTVNVGRMVDGKRKNGRGHSRRRLKDAIETMRARSPVTA